MRRHEAAGSVVRETTSLNALLGRGLIMKARQHIDGTSFGPEALKVLGQAFDEAWQSIAGDFGTDPAVVETARWKLADAILSVASDHSRNVEELKSAALRVMALNYRTSRAAT